MGGWMEEGGMEGRGGYGREEEDGREKSYFSAAAGHAVPVCLQGSACSETEQS